MSDVQPVCGIDVHSRLLITCIIDKSVSPAWNSFENTPIGILELISYLKRRDVSKVAMESTGNYASLLYDMLLTSGLEPMLLNAYKAKHADPNKTDKRDAYWLAKIVRSNLTKGSYVPDATIEKLRILTRERVALVDMRSDIKRRIISLLVRAGIRLDNVFRNITCKASVILLRGLAAGKSVDEIAEGNKVIAQRANKIKALMASKDNSVALRQVSGLLDIVDAYTRQIELIEEQIDEYLKPHRELVELLESMPGVGRTSAAVIIAEIGRIDRFKSAKKLISYAGLCPVTKQSGQKMSKKNPTDKCNKRLRRIMFHVALGAIRKGTPIISSLYHRQLLRGHVKKQAIMAVSAKMLTYVYVIWRRGEKWNHEKAVMGVKRSVKELQERKLRAMIKALERSGYRVIRDSEKVG